MTFIQFYVLNFFVYNNNIIVFTLFKKYATLLQEGLSMFVIGRLYAANALSFMSAHG